MAESAKRKGIERVDEAVERLGHPRYLPLVLIILGLLVGVLYFLLEDLQGERMATFDLIDPSPRVIRPTVEEVKVELDPQMNPLRLSFLVVHGRPSENGWHYEVELIRLGRREWRKDLWVAEPNPERKLVHTERFRVEAPGEYRLRVVPRSLGESELLALRVNVERDVRRRPWLLVFAAGLVLAGLIRNAQVHDSILRIWGRKLMRGAQVAVKPLGEQ